MNSHFAKKRPGLNLYSDFSTVNPNNKQNGSKKSKGSLEKKEIRIWNISSQLGSRNSSILSIDSSLAIKNASPLTFYQPKHMQRDNEQSIEFAESDNSSCNKNDLKSTSSYSSSSSYGPIVSFHNINYSVRTRKLKRMKFSYESRKLLDDVSGLFKPGMNAILGPTGCGKTTLLDILAGRKSHKNLSGQILIDGCKQPNNFKCMAGYVVQDDMIMGTLTVRENLMFSANIRLVQSVKKKEKEFMVDRIIEELGLSKCAHTKVGTEFIRGVSGGERKRTCIGMELVVSPSILFLDEPTTGLDAFTANSVMSLLHRQSSKFEPIPAKKRVSISVSRPDIRMFGRNHNMKKMKTLDHFVRVLIAYALNIWGEL